MKSLSHSPVSYKLLITCVISLRLPPNSLSTSLGTLSSSYPLVAFFTSLCKIRLSCLHLPPLQVRLLGFLVNHSLNHGALQYYFPKFSVLVSNLLLYSLESLHSLNRIIFFPT
jgi:hypothetical protein